MALDFAGSAHLEWANTHSGLDVDVLTYACWFYMDATTGQVNLFTTASALSGSPNVPKGQIYISGGGADNLAFDYKWTSLTPHWHFSTTPSTGAWHSIVVTYDRSSDANDPTMVYDGTNQSITKAGVGPSGSATGSTDSLAIASAAGGGNEVDGRVCEAAIWTGALSLAEQQAYANGVSPMRIRPASLLFYCPVYAVVAVQSELADGIVATALDGTPTVAGHAPVQPPMPGDLWTSFPAASGGETKQGAVAMSGTGALAAVASPTKRGAVAMSGAGTLAAVASPIKRGSASFSGTGALSVSATAIAPSPVSGKSGMLRFGGAISK